MIETVTDTFTLTAPVFNQSVLEKVELRQKPATVSNARKVDLSNDFKLSNFAAQSSENSRSKVRENRQLTNHAVFNSKH